MGCLNKGPAILTGKPSGMDEQLVLHHLLYDNVNLNSHFKKSTF